MMLAATNMFIDSFIGYLRVERNYSVHTLRAYAGDLRAFEEYLSRLDESLSFADVDADIVRAWVAELMDEGAAPSSVSRRITALRVFFNYLRSEGHVSSNPVAVLQGPKRRKRLPAFVKEAEMDKLLDGGKFAEDYVGCRDRMIVMCFYSAGLRLSELVGLDLKDVDFSKSVIKVFGKRAKVRVVPFGGEMKAELEKYLCCRATVASGSDALFLSKNGGRISRSAVYRMVRKALKDVTSLSKRSPHVLRHSFATAMLNNDAELGAVKELLGHERLATTEIYTHLTFEELKRFYDKAHPRAGSD